MSAKVLITAFEPYDIWSENASWLALMELTKTLPDAPKIVTRRYPVDFQEVPQRLMRDLQENFDYVLHLGQAPGSSRIRLEAIGLNIGGAIGQTAEEFSPLLPKAPTAYHSTLPLGHWAALLRESGIPATVSYHAGTYLCNALLYWSLHYARVQGLKSQVTFIHVPLVPQQITGNHRDYPTMAVTTLAQAVRLILNELSGDSSQMLADTR